MIIDSHVHIGSLIKFNMPKEMVIESMKKYNIDFSLISNIEGAEVDCDQEPIKIEDQHSQEEINKSAIDFARNNKDKIGVLLWTRPRNESATKEFEDLIINNRDIVYGIKVHPFHSKIPFDSDKVQEYIKIAQKYNLPVLTHTANDDCSSPRRVYEMALKYPKVKFIMGHMGLGTNNEEAIDYISKLPNLYGDTTWVLPDKAEKMIKKCGADKLLFGSDNPIDGLDTYNHKDFYKIYFDEFKNKIDKESYNKIMYKNAIKVFNIKAFM